MAWNESVHVLFTNPTGNHACMFLEIHAKITSEPLVCRTTAKSSKVFQNYILYVHPPHDSEMKGKWLILFLKMSNDFDLSFEGIRLRQ